MVRSDGFSLDLPFFQNPLSPLALDPSPSPVNGSSLAQLASSFLVPSSRSGIALIGSVFRLDPIVDVLGVGREPLGVGILDDEGWLDFLELRKVSVMVPGSFESKGRRTGADAQI
jgi:hypothetical protein